MTKMPNPPTRLECAFHEAGHAAIAHFSQLLRLDGDVEIGKGSDHGSTGIALRDDGNVADYDNESCVVAAAGYVAQERYLERSGLFIDKRALELGATDDLKKVIERAGSGTFPKFVESARQRLDCHWPAVERLAAELDRTGLLSADRAAQILVGDD